MKMLWWRSILWGVAGIMILLELAVTQPVAASQVVQERSRTFPETGQTIAGAFLDYWESNGGVAQFGFPISDARVRMYTVSRKSYLTQYFERAIFELHPETTPPNQVLLSLLGTQIYWQRYPDGAPNQITSTLNPQLYKETGKTIGGKFREFWETHGNLTLLGFPISDELQERSLIDGRIYTVQYFERALLELHSENPAPNQVLLAQLGTIAYNASSSTQPQAQPLPKEDKGWIANTWDWFSQSLLGIAAVVVICLLLLPLALLGRAIRTSISGYQGVAVRRSRRISLIGIPLVVTLALSVFMIGGTSALLPVLGCILIPIVLGFFGMAFVPEFMAE